jgi:hypothetical protein
MEFFSRSPNLLGGEGVTYYSDEACVFRDRKTSPLFSDVELHARRGSKIETDFGDYLPFSHREICVFRNRKARRVLLMQTTCEGLKIEGDSEITFR